MKRVELAVTRPLPSYLVAFVVGPFELIDGGTAGTDRHADPVRDAPGGAPAELGYAREVTPRVVAALRGVLSTCRTPTASSMSRSVPRFWGTMEHPGIVAMGAASHVDPARSGRRAGRKAPVRDHPRARAVAITGFGDLVTMGVVGRQPGLNEALGQWSDMNITEAAEPTWRWCADARIGPRGGVRWPATRPWRANAIRQPVNTRQRASRCRSTTTSPITRASSVFRMFESSVGPEVWQRFLQTYLRAHAWGNASRRRLPARRGPTSSGRQVAAAMRGFLERPGRAPDRRRAALARAGAPPRLELTQQRSAARPVSPIRGPPPWTVPVCRPVRHCGGELPPTASRLSTPAASFELGRGRRQGAPLARAG